MPAEYPGAIYAPRTKENKVGEVYDPLKTTVLYAEDIVNDDNEIVAIETELGTNPKGTWASVAENLSELWSAISSFVTSFIELSDAPASYVGAGGKVVAVKADASGLEFITASGGTKCTGAEIDTGTDDAKFATPKAIADSNLAFLSDIPTVPVKASGAEIVTGTDDEKFATSKALTDSLLLIPRYHISSKMEDLAGFLVQKSGSGNVTASSLGPLVVTGATANSYASFQTDQINESVVVRQPIISCSLSSIAWGNQGELYIGSGEVNVNGTALTWTTHHFGFKIIKTGGVVTAYATNADGSTEKATALGVTVATKDTLTAVYTPGVDIKYYVNGVLKVTHTQNLPTAGGKYVPFRCVLNNANNASDTQIKVGWFDYSNRIH